MAGSACGRTSTAHSLYWENAFGFSVLVTPRGDGGFEVLAYHFDLERERDPDLRARNHQRSLRWALHFPLFDASAPAPAAPAPRQRAGGPRTPPRALVFCGLNGSASRPWRPFWPGRPGLPLHDRQLPAGPT